MWESPAGSRSEPFAAGQMGQVAVKVIDERDNELMVVRTLAEAEPERRRRLCSLTYWGIFFVDTPVREAAGMRVQVQKWGNSLALRIPKPFAEDVGVSEGTVVDVSVSKGRLIAAPVAARRARLDDLLRRVTKRNLHGETGTGAAVGREAW